MINNKDPELVDVIRRYDLHPDSDWSDVLEELCAKDSRLDLAVAMYKTRCDWNDGPYRVKYALNKLKIETETDQEIYDCVSGIVNNWENHDGRSFRDCKWNYDVLFDGAEDQKLMRDILLALRKTDLY